MRGFSCLIKTTLFVKNQAVIPEYFNIFAAYKSRKNENINFTIY